MYVILSESVYDKEGIRFWELMQKKSSSSWSSGRVSTEKKPKKIIPLDMPFKKLSFGFCISLGFDHDTPRCVIRTIRQKVLFCISNDFPYPIPTF